MSYEQIFPLIASLALLIWLAPSVFRMDAAARQMSAKLAFGMVILGILVALVGFVAG